MKYLGLILGLCFVVYAAFAMYTYTPAMIKGAKLAAVDIFNLLQSTTNKTAVTSSR